MQKFCANQCSPRTEKKRYITNQNDNFVKRPKDQSYVESVAQTLSQVVENNLSHVSYECAICLDNPKIDEAVLTQCGHTFCRSCLVGSLQAAARERAAKAEATVDGFSKNGILMQIPDGLCPTCQEKVEAKRIIAFSKSCDGDGAAVTSKFLSELKPSSRTIKHEIRETEEGNQFAMARQILANAVSGTESSKMKALMKELYAVWKLDPESRVLIFSHYLGFLDLLEKNS